MRAPALIYMVLLKITPVVRQELFFSVSKKSVTFLHAEKRHIFCEAQASRKISLRSSKSLIAQAFLMAMIQFEAGLFSLRLGHGAALTCPRHVIHSRAAASLPLKLPRCAVIFPQQRRFFDSCAQKLPRPFGRGSCGFYIASISLMMYSLPVTRYVCSLWQYGHTLAYLTVG